MMPPFTVSKIFDISGYSNLSAPDLDDLILKNERFYCETIFVYKNVTDYQFLNVFLCWNLFQ